VGSPVCAICVPLSRPPPRAAKLFARVELRASRSSRQVAPKPEKDIFPLRHSAAVAFGEWRRTRHVCRRFRIKRRIGAPGAARPYRTVTLFDDSKALARVSIVTRMTNPNARLRVATTTVLAVLAPAVLAAAGCTANTNTPQSPKSDPDPTATNSAGITTDPTNNPCVSSSSGSLSLSAHSGPSRPSEAFFPAVTSFVAL
jgi:hypothetical protein